MKFNLLTKYLFVYAAVALLGFLGVTFISYRIDYAKVYNYYTDALYKQALSISSEYADDYFSEEHLRIVETELRTVALLNDTRIMFIDTAGNIILDTAYAQEHNTKDILYTIDGFDYVPGRCGVFNYAHNICSPFTLQAVRLGTVLLIYSIIILWHCF